MDGVDTQSVNTISSLRDTRRRIPAMPVESRTGAVAERRFPSPLIKPDVPISGIRLSDWFHRTAFGGGPT